MKFKRILLDTNVCLDAMLERGDFAADALRILDLSEQKVIEGVISAHCIDTLFIFSIRLQQLVLHIMQSMHYDQSFKLFPLIRSSSILRCHQDGLI